MNSWSQWKMQVFRASLALLLPGMLACSSAETARLGDLKLESGEEIKDCRIPYRTRGRLNSDRSNAVLVIPWFQGTSVQAVLQVGPGKLVDTSKFFVIVADTLGNGAASSPSNSVLQPGASFPRFTSRDIVEAQYRLITERLQLRHLHAVIGISMGGMLVFEWTMAHPEFMSKAVAIVGSPQMQADDLQRWNEARRWLANPRWRRFRTQLSLLQPRAAVAEMRLHSEDQLRQIDAMSNHDISRRFGGSLDRAAAALQAELLVVTTWGDREVNPKPAFDFARLAAAELLELDGRCGHQAPSCERATLWPAVGRFLSR